MAINKKQSGGSVSKKYKDDDWRKIVAVVLIGVAGFIFFIVVIVIGAINAPLKVGDELVADIQAKNDTSAYNLLSADAQKVTPADQFKTYVSNASVILTGKPNTTSKKIQGETGKPATSEIIYEIKGSDNVTYTMIVRLTKENDVWKVLGFKVDKK